ncbi:hypothetical protein PIROE2DRAFT_2213 [Piromyces sp. E2]|nr:hypothetical protein PIROE2DRAFT_2213 [Piromyces sp. E2]|eukprot:OUM69790.1 hypothetical protein PIROE2DRAFT_2213 [Piromyces sp. E2]
MKFTTPQVATSAVLAYPQAGQNGMEGVPKDCDVNCFIKSSDCVYVEDKYSTGVISIYENFSIKVLESSEQFCPLYKSEKCKNFYNNLMPNATKCGILDKKDVKELEQGLKFLETVCVTDQNNKICSIFTKAGKNNKNKNETLKDTCKSKICTDAYLKIVENFYVFNKDYVYDENNEKNAENIFAFLQSDYCTAQHAGATNTNNVNAANTTNAPNTTNVANNDNAQNHTSGATTMKYSIFGTLLALAYALL